MIEPAVSHDTSAYEARAERDADGRLTEQAALRVRELLDAHGFVVVPDVLSEREADTGLRLVRDTIADPRREVGTFASQTDIRYGRRDFVPLPSTGEVLGYASRLVKRLDKVLAGTCKPTSPVVEISTLTSHRGGSHQYLHRDPGGVICMFVAVDDVSPTQGGTVFAPGTHLHEDGAEQQGGEAALLMRLLQARTNLRILRDNLAQLRRMRRTQEPRITLREFRDRTLSRLHDSHQPNVLRFLTGRNPVFSIRSLGPRTLVRMLRHRKTLDAAFPLVQVAMRKGTVVLYHSDILHAGPDNRSMRPRSLFSMSIARDILDERLLRAGYSPHSSLRANPRTLGDLLDMPDAITEVGEGQTDRCLG